jgi:tRNA A-37 threonylcarbamoyl transferase component Bud32
VNDAILQKPAPEPRGSAVGGRYRIDELIGRGGMADVYRVHDLGSDTVLALKRLRAIDDEAKQQRSIELFEREFHTLSQLSHPRVVTVSDYGIDVTPYYTMELLDGGDLQERSPIEWRLSCAITRDVCSVLSLLHSRRMLYRDMSPRNVRLAREGQAKVIDFGAMAPMGVCKQVVGTPAFCPPEALHMQPLDARSDLYALGATLYFILTGRRAYPARDFRQLREIWDRPPRRPSELIPEIPAALDLLVMQLLALDPAARPSSAGEVMERLSAVAELPKDEEIAVSAAYLSTPTLVARDKELARIRKKIAGSQQANGGAALIKGASGVGRSRLLDTCILDAKLAGATVLRADATDAQSGEYGVVRVLARQMLEIWPEAALEVAASSLDLLGHVVPELLAAAGSTQLQSFDDQDLLRAALQPALRRWFLGVARTRPPMVVAIDDVDRIDEPSAAFAALLAYEAPGWPLLVLTTARSDTPRAQASLKLLSDASAKVTLDNLRPEHGEDLLRSIFGDVPHLRRLAVRLHGLSRGNPRDVMTLAQHLLDRGLVRYEAGTWSLPSSIDPGELPSSMAQALHVQVSALSADARELAQAMALCADQRLSLAECLRLSSHGEANRVLVSLDRLTSGEIVRLASERYAIAQENWLAPLRATLEPEAERALHLRLAELFERRGAGLRVAQHLLRGGAEERGLDALIEFAERSQRETDKSTEAFFELIRSLPVGWFECFEHAISLCDRLGRPRRLERVLRTRQTSLQSSLTGVTRTDALAQLVQLLARAGGVDLAAELDSALGPKQRLERALALAEARYERTTEHERVLEPRAAIAQLARTMITAGAISSGAHDHSLLDALPSLAVYAPLSPVIEVVDTLMSAIRARLTARLSEARTGYQSFLDRLAQPDRAGLGASYHRHSKLGTLYRFGLMDAAMGLPGSVSMATELETDALYHVNAWQVRMVFHLWQGQVREAEHCQKQVDLLKIQNSPRQWADDGHLIGEVTAHAAIGGLMQVKRTIDPIEALAKQHAGWVPILHYARGEYQRLRGDLTAALRELEAGLKLTHAGGHCIWGNLASASLSTLIGLGRSQEAVTRGRAWLEIAIEQGLGFVVSHLRMPLALAEMQVGELEAAGRTAEGAVVALRELGSTGIGLGLAYETCARVASAARDQEGFERYAGLCAEQYRASENRALIARYDRLLEEARQAELSIPLDVADAAAFTETGTGTIVSQITTMMEGCRGPTERAQRGLELLVKSSGSRQGFLYMLVDKAPALSAQLADRELPTEIEVLARESLLGEMRSQTEGHTQTATITVTLMGELDKNDADESLGPNSIWTLDNGERYRPVLLRHATSDGFVSVGLAVLLEDPDRPFVYPARLAADLSRHAYDSGDASALTSNDAPRRE